MGRSRKFVLLCGEREVGKSSRVQELIFAKEERTCVYDLSMQPIHMTLPEIDLEKMKLQRSGIYRCHDVNYKEFFNVLYNHWGSKEGRKIGGRAFIEDFSAVLKPNIEQAIYSMAIGLRHRNVDLTGITHTIKETPRYIIPQLNEFIFLKTGDSWDEVAERFPERVRDRAREKFYIVQNHPSRFHFEILTIIPTGTKSW